MMEQAPDMQAEEYVVTAPEEVDQSSSATVADSLATLGYALFAWQQRVPLEQVKPMTGVIAALKQEVEQATVPVDAPAAPAASVVDADVSAISEQVPDVVEEPPAVAAPVAAEPVPVPAAGYTGAGTLAMLNEISFLDE